MTLHDEIKQLNDVFLDTESGFAELVWHLPAGNTAAKKEYPAIVDWSDIDGGGVRHSAHRSGSRDIGRTKDVVASIELDATVKIVGGGRDQFEVVDPQSGEKVILSVGDQIGRDEGLQAWSLRKIGSLEPSRPNYRGS